MTVEPSCKVSFTASTVDKEGEKPILAFLPPVVSDQTKAKAALSRV